MLADDEPLSTATTHPGLVQTGMVGGKYRLVRRLGKGGMADVWEGEHLELRRPVAMKFVLPEWLAEPSAMAAVLERFRFEAQVSARLCERSSHVVAVYDFGTHEGTPYLVMELVAGRTLEDEIQSRGKLPPEEVAEILEQAGQALDAAHAVGVVHRDLKPSNLLLGRAAGGGFNVKVADFGVAKAFSPELLIDRPRETSAGALVGSPAFMSPEQIDNRPSLDGRSDVWALGAVTYEALTGVACFDGPTLLRVLAAVSRARFVAMRDHVPDLPPALDGWLRRALTVDADKRFATVGAMAAAFRACLTKPAAPSWSPPRGLMWLGAGVLALSLAVVAGIELLGAVPPAANASEPAAPPTAASAWPTVTPALTPAPSSQPAPSQAPATNGAATGGAATGGAAARPGTASTSPSANAPAAVPSAAASPVPSSTAAAPTGVATATRPKKWMDPSEIQ